MPFAEFSLKILFSEILLFLSFYLLLIQCSYETQRPLIATRTAHADIYGIVSKLSTLVSLLSCSLLFPFSMYSPLRLSYITYVLRFTSNANLTLPSVAEPKGNVQPRISVEKHSRRVVKVGDDVTLPCVAQGFPVPTYR